MLSRFGTYIARHHIGLIALVIALSGTAYAASKVGTKDIRAGAVRSKQIANGQVKAKDLAAPVKKINHHFSNTNGNKVTLAKTGPLRLLGSCTAILNASKVVLYARGRSSDELGFTVLRGEADTNTATNSGHGLTGLNNNVQEVTNVVSTGDPAMSIIDGVYRSKGRVVSFSVLTSVGDNDQTCNMRGTLTTAP